MHAPVSPQDGLARAMPAPPPDVEPYVLLPEPLALDLRESDLAIGVYLVVARLYLVHQAPIPLSAADIQAFDGGTLRRGAVLRALDRLCAGGWLITAERRGHKTTYLPAWGLSRGAARPWTMDVDGLGRPRGVRALRIPRIVLDVCLGRLTPHRRHAALITRYVTRPPLTLRDLGVYGLAWASIPRTTPALDRLALVGESGPLPPPSPSALLARIAQLPLGEADPAAPGLSPQGLRRAGLLPEATSSTSEQPPLLFVPPAMIGAVIPPMIPESIDDMIGPPALPEEASAAAAGDGAPLTPCPLPAAGTPGSGATLANRANSTTNHAAPPKPMGGGGIPTSSLPRPHGRQVLEKGGGANPSAPLPTAYVAAPAPAPLAPPNTPSEVERALLAVGVRRDVARQFIERPLTQVARVIGQARARQGVRDIAGWVVSALRALPEGEPEPAAPPPKVSDLAILTHPGLTNHERMRWLTRFRNADPADRAAVLTRFHAEHPDTEHTLPSAGTASPCSPWSADR